MQSLATPGTSLRYVATRRRSPSAHLDFNLRQLHDCSPGAFVDYLNLMVSGSKA